MTLSVEIRGLAARLTEAGYALPTGPAADALLGAAARIADLAIDVAALEERVRSTERAAARAVGLFGGPHEARSDGTASADLPVLARTMERVERALEAASRGDGMPPLDCRAAALLLRGAAQIAAYAVRRASDADVLEAMASDLDPMPAAALPPRYLVIPVEGGGGIVIPLDAWRSGARSIPIDDGRPS